MSKESRFRQANSYIMGEDFTKEEYDKWLLEIALWLSEIRVNEPDPKGKAKLVLDAAIKGTKLDGRTPWKQAENLTLDARVKTLCSYDILKGVGRKPVKKSAKTYADKKVKDATQKQDIKHSEAVRQKIELKSRIKQRDAFRKVLVKEFPFLDNDVYETNVNAYCDTIVKLQEISDRFLGADGKELENLISIRESLKKDVDDFMKILKIHPSQIKDKVDEGDRGDVGTLIRNWEDYKELGEIFEQVDAIQEAIQIIHQLETLRVDGSPQLAEWLLWHKTGCRGHDFTCECGRQYELHGGFSKEEMYEIAEQAFKVYGYGIKRINEQSGENTEEVEEVEA